MYTKLRSLSCAFFVLSLLLARASDAADPSPADGVADVPPDVTLSWSPGDYVPAVNGHKVFLSKDFDTVNDDVGGILQDPNTYIHGELLEFGQTYFWRVDEANSTTGWNQGDIWQFTVEPIAYPLAGENVTAKASSGIHQISRNIRMSLVLLIKTMSHDSCGLYKSGSCGHISYTLLGGYH